MQKKLLSIAIAGALAVPSAAMADVTSAGSDITIYGKFHASWDYVDSDSAGGLDDGDDNTAVFRNSRLGFKGAEDLGDGLKAVWQIETHLDTDDDAANGDNTGNVSLRNTYVGLSGDQWGTVFFGRHDSPYKTATAKLDIFSDTIADYNNIIGRTVGGNPNNGIATFNTRAPQVVAYETPNFNGFKGQVARMSVSNPEPAVNDETEAWSAMGMYDQGPFFGSLAYEVHSGGFSASAANQKIDAWKLGLGYAFGNSKLGFVYEDIEDDANNSALSRDAFWASFAHKFGANEVKLSYGKADDSDAPNANDGADAWSIGIDHNFSKRTKVYAIYTNMDNDPNGFYPLNAADNLNAATGTAYNAGLDNNGNATDIDAFSVGIIHNF